MELDVVSMEGKRQQWVWCLARNSCTDEMVSRSIVLEKPIYNAPFIRTFSLYIFPQTPQNFLCRNVGSFVSIEWTCDAQVHQSSKTIL